jgi:hypothetical protein
LAAILIRVRYPSPQHYSKKAVEIGTKINFTWTKGRILVKFTNELWWELNSPSIFSPKELTSLCYLPLQSIKDCPLLNKKEEDQEQGKIKNNGINH